MLARSALFALVSALMLATVAHAQPREVLTDELDGGGRIEREVTVDATGTLVFDGRFREWYPNGQLAAEGNYADDLRQGKWSFWHTNGQLEGQGCFKNDVIRGRWDYWHANGQKAGEGFYKDGLRNSKWLHWDDAGKYLKSDSGEYEAELGDYASGRRAFAGERKGKYRHGHWCWWDAEGRLMADGHYQRGRRTRSWSAHWTQTGHTQVRGEFERDERVGRWEFWHADGTFDPEMVSGTYSRNKRKNVDERPVEGPLDLAALPTLPVPPQATRDELQEIEDTVDFYLQAAVEDREETAYVLSGFEYACVPAVLRALANIDLEDSTATALAASIEGHVLGPLFGGHRFGWQASTEPEAVRANRLTVLRWFSWWSIAHDQTEYLESLAENEPGEVPSLYLLLPPTPAPDPLGAALAAEPPIARLTRRDRERLVREGGGRGTENALQRALVWISRQQNEAGNWAAPTAAEETSATVGVSALALLALLADGNTPSAGAHAGSVERGLAWLVAQQDESGRFGRVDADPLLPEHAIALTALIEAQLAGDESFMEPIERGLAYLLEQRSANGAWHHAGPQSALNDTLSTAWAATALSLAEEAGTPFSDGDRHAVLTWINQSTDPETGAVGYAGPVVAETPADMPYPIADSPAMTGAGLFARCLLGQTKRRVPLMRHHADVLDQRAPSATETADPWHWYFGSYALFQIGGKRWLRWAEALREATTATQLVGAESDERGSWEPEGPLGEVGGRVLTTALHALCLEVYHRYPRMAQ